MDLKIACIGSAQSDSIYGTITPKSNLSAMLNRKSGNFSTNLTEILLNIRLNRLDEYDEIARAHSFKAGVIIYHDRFLELLDFGGFSDQDIKIYGRFRFLFIPLQNLRNSDFS